MRVWDTFFAFVQLYTIIYVPLAYVFNEHFHDNQDEDGVNFYALDIFFEVLWTLAFLININRVNPTLKIFKFKDTVKAYLRSPFMIPDAAILISCWFFLVIGRL